MTDIVDSSQDPVIERPSLKERAKNALRGFPQDLIPLVVLCATVILVILYATDWKFWDGQQGVETTNDAYIRSDVTPLSTKVSGTVAKVYIDDFDRVKKGQLLVELRNDDFIARMNEAQAVYKQAQATEATIAKQLEVQTQHIESARLNTSIGSQDIVRSISTVAGTQASISASQASLEEAKSEKSQAMAKLLADQAVALRASQERQRQVDLFAENASTKQTVEQVVADDDRQKSVVKADQAEIARLAALIQQRAAEIEKSKEDLRSSKSQNTQSIDQLKSRDAQLIGEKKQLEVLQNQLKEARATTEARLAAYNVAKVELDYTKIVAPIDGALSERKVRAGQQVNAGTQVVTIVSSAPWVIASYRETQIRKMNVGDRAEISVDALGGARLTGKVQSISPASEAQFALLPPDNPSGNFTKITQRLPIKITIDRGQKELEKLRPGLTVIARVWPN